MKKKGLHKEPVIGGGKIREFDAFCKKTISNAACNLVRDIALTHSREILGFENISELDMQEAVPDIADFPAPRHIKAHADSARLKEEDR